MPPMPSRIGRGRSRPKKAILTPDQVGRLLEAALKDDRKGIYSAFPFLTGVRPSEQLALLWQDVDFDTGLIRIRRVQEQDGTIAEFTKTAAGMRDIPMSPMLRAMLVKWRAVCPRGSSSESKVFPTLGNVQWRRCWGAFVLRELSRHLLATSPEVTWPALRDAPQCSPRLHQHAPSPGDRGWSGGQAGRSRQCHRDAGPLHASGAWR